jgi:hypothetical protein
MTGTGGCGCRQSQTSGTGFEYGQSQTAGTGCGCGQSQTAGTGCGSGRAASAGVVYDGGFTRPSFFDGQLLTADDLQALNAYVRGKDRLHNRYLTGSGVVCGLDVVCSCADPARVVVHAGYALDCCGNDIVVACDQSIDISELVGLLPRDASCVDPCQPPTKADPKGDKDKEKDKEKDGKNGTGNEGQKTGETGTTDTSGGTSEKGTKTDDDAGQPRCYELVVEYAETPTDLIAPYSSGDATSRACEPTRVREGYRFRLRCACKRPTPPTLVNALACCAEAEAELKMLESAVIFVHQLARPDADSTPTASPNADELGTAIEEFHHSADVKHAARVTGLAILAATTGEMMGPAKAALQEVRVNLSRVHDAAKPDLLAMAQAADLAELLDSAQAHPDQLTHNLELLTKGVVSGDHVIDLVRSLVTKARDWALYWLEQRPGSHCRLSDTLSAIRVPADNGKALEHAVTQVASAVRQILIDCICAATNPPCAPCEDEAVVLAHIRVDRCEVVDICNQVRRHAITGTALAYWLPLEWLYCEIGQVCCCGTDKVGGLTAARSLLRALGTTRTDCGWPKSWMSGQDAGRDWPDKSMQTLLARVEQLEAIAGQQPPEEPIQNATEPSQSDQTPADNRSNAERTPPAKKAAVQRTPPAKKAAVQRTPPAKKAAVQRTPPAKKAAAQRKRVAPGGNPHG